ncbi:MAG: hypothetical protein ACHQRM_05810 [Bacteroidia bacterium]
MSYWKKYTVAFVSLVLGLLCPSTTTLYGCGYYPNGQEYRFWFMQPDMGHDNNLYNFYFSTNHYYGDENWDTEFTLNHFVVAGTPEPSAYTENVKEWMNKLKPFIINADDVHQLLYETTPQDFLNMEVDMQNAVAPKAHQLLHNTFFNALHRASSRELLRYFIFAKKSESLTNQPGPWGEISSDFPALDYLIKEGELELGKTKDDFFVLRYAYQIIKMAHYRGNVELAKKTYALYFRNRKNDSWLQSSALFYTVQLERTRPDYTYQLSKVFDCNTDKRDRILKLFTPKEMPGALRFVKNKHEEAVLYAMKEMMHPGQSLKTLQHIYALDPGCKELGTLLVREINKVEDWIYTPRLTKFECANYYTDSGDRFGYRLRKYWRDQEYLALLYAFVENIARSGHPSDPALWKICSAHLSLLTGNIPDCRAKLNLLTRQFGSSSRFQAQIKVLSLVADANSQAGIDPDFRNRVMDDLYWIDSHKDLVFEYPTFRAQLLLFLSSKFINNSDVATGVMLLTKNIRPIGMIPNHMVIYTWEDMLHEKGKPKDYDRLISLLNKKNKTPFEKYFISDSCMQISRLLDGKGTYYVLQDKLDSAYSCFKKIDPAFWEQGAYGAYMNVNPFYIDQAEAHKRNKHDSLKYNNKARYVGRMLELRKEIETGINAGKNAYLLGNAYYSMTWYGNSWLMSRKYWSSSELNGWEQEEANTFGRVYYGCSRAERCYLQAMYASKDNQMASLSAFMASICRRNSAMYGHACSKNHDKEFKFKTNYWLSYILTNYKDKSYFEDFRECKTLESYIAGIN